MAFFDVPEGTWCYQCDSWTNSGCGEDDSLYDKEKEFLVNCHPISYSQSSNTFQSAPQTCLKEITYFHHDKNSPPLDPYHRCKLKFAKESVAEIFYTLHSFLQLTAPMSSDIAEYPWIQHTLGARSITIVASRRMPSCMEFGQKDGSALVLETRAILWGKMPWALPYWLEPFWLHW